MLSSLRGYWPIGLLLVCASGAVISMADEPANSKEDLVDWRLPVATRIGVSKETLEVCESLASTLSGGRTSTVIQSDKNPICVFWMEIDDWNPTSNRPGFIVQIGAHGARVLATDLQQLKAAVAAVQKMAKREHTSVVLPIGLITNHRLIDSGPSGRRIGEDQSGPSQER